MDTFSTGKKNSKIRTKAQRQTATIKSPIFIKERIIPRINAMIPVKTESVACKIEGKVITLKVTNGT